jgi:hypothetical protein
MYVKCVSCVDAMPAANLRYSESFPAAPAAMGLAASTSRLSRERASADPLGAELTVHRFEDATARSHLGMGVMVCGPPGEERHFCPMRTVHDPEALIAEPSIRSLISAWLRSRPDIESFAVIEHEDGEVTFEIVGRGERESRVVLRIRPR